MRYERTDNQWWCPACLTEAPGELVAARAFAARLEHALEIPVELYDERFTTRIAALGISEALRSRARHQDEQGVMRGGGVRDSPLYRLTRAQPAEMPSLIEMSRRHLDHVRVALEDRNAALLANHGTVTVAGDPRAAVDLTLLLEYGCELYWRAAQVGAPRALDVADRQAVIDQVVKLGYGAVKAT